MRVAVTGASGHIGGNLVRALLAQGVRPRVLVHEDARALDGLDVERVPGDVLDPESLVRAFTGVELVYHLAARISLDDRDEAAMRQLNVLGPRNVVAACLKAGVRRLLHFSSIHALASQPTELPVDETRPPASGRVPAYDRCKAAGEAEVADGIRRGLDAVIVNPTGCVGPHDYRPSPMGEIFLDLCQRKLPGLVDGDFDWVDVRDVADGAIAAAEKGRKGERYLLSGHRASVRDYAALVEGVSGVKAPRLVSPMWLARSAAPFVTWYARAANKRPLFTAASLHALRNHRDVRHDKATAELGYTPRPLRATVEDTYAWFREARAL